MYKINSTGKRVVFIYLYFTDDYILLVFKKLHFYIIYFLCAGASKQVFFGRFKHFLGVF